jgi:hydroxyacylglutathione hydrolase
MHEICQHGPITEWKWSTDNKLLPKPFWTSCYVVDGLLIDSGAPGGAGELKEFLLALPPEQKIAFCVITHAHEDHAGGAKMVSEELGIPVYMNPNGLKLVHNGYAYPDYRQLTWGTELLPAPKVQPLPAAPFRTKGGFYNFELFPMPGHAPCLVALVERSQQWAFVADAVQPKYQMIFGAETSIKENIAAIYGSLIRFAKFTREMTHLKLFIAGHGMIENGVEYVKERAKEIRDLHEQVHQCRQEGLSDRKALQKIFGGESFIGGFTRGTLSRLNLLKGLQEWPL